MPDASSVRLLALLDEHLSAGAAVQLTAHCTDATPEGAAVAVAADAAGCALVLMTAPGACKKLHREETIQVTQSLLTCAALSPAATSAAQYLAPHRRPGLINTISS